MAVFVLRAACLAQVFMMLSSLVKSLKLILSGLQTKTTHCLFANAQVVNNNWMCVPFCPRIIKDTDISYPLLIPQIIIVDIPAFLRIETFL